VIYRACSIGCRAGAETALSNDAQPVRLVTSTVANHGHDRKPRNRERLVGDCGCGRVAKAPS
jgi:hypothetical protein